MTVIERLKQFLDKNNMKVPTVATATGIPATNIHKWIQGRAKPKYEDTIKLEKFLKGEIVPRETNGAAATVPDVDQFLVSKMLKSDAMQEVILSVLAELLSKQTGQSVTSVLSQLERSVADKQSRIKEELRKSE